MEVAGQWRREWAGTAEFGKVTEGGVTRQVARAMEVLHASAPGTRVRVMRAAYHSTAGPGVPASSYMLHSSRRVISSGFNLLESPPSITSFPSKPLEISSTPLDSFPDLSPEGENYKVTEPDDTDISEPSKWRVAQNGSNLRMPSEESSSTDNASIIDLDNRSPHRSIFRKYSYDSENSDILSSKKSTARASPLLDAPVTLSTLKYKSLLNSSNDWNNRRKSYSFEDTCPANESIIHSNDILAMESSTDSGICKSTEIVNDQGDESNYFSSIEKPHGNIQVETFKDWRHKNRSNTAFKGTQLMPWRQHETVIEDPTENKISLKSPGKVCITVPITIEKDHTNEENDRRVKKVEFCKTELHFAAESGRVNIIATDEKPPPSNDFRKRKSAFVPITDKFEKPITLFGEKGETPESIKSNDYSIYGNSDITEDEIENTAATKSILKNKIPKPKPYLLGENTVLGTSEDIYENGRAKESNVASGVLLINKQLQSQSKYSTAKVSTFMSEDDTGYKNDHVRTMNKGPTKLNTPVYDKAEKNKHDLTLQSEINKITTVKKKIHSLPMSPATKPKTRQLRDSDLMYFGVDNDKNNSVKDKTNCMETILSSDSNVTDNIFQSVKLIKRISNSACNSEAESDDGPEYQNIIMKTNLSQPTPKPRSKYNVSTDIAHERVLHPIVEQYYNSNKINESRRSRTKKYEEVVAPAPRSRSEPAKKQFVHEDKVSLRDNTPSNSMKRTSPSPRIKKHQDIEQRRRKSSTTKREIQKSSVSEDEAPLYVNLKTKIERNPKSTYSDWQRQQPNMKQDEPAELKVSSYKTKQTVQESSTQPIRKSPDKTKSNNSRQSLNKVDSLERRQRSVKKTSNIHRTKKLLTPENSFSEQRAKRITDTIVINEHDDIDNKNEAVIIKPKQRSHSSHRKVTNEKYIEQKQSEKIDDKEKHPTKHSKAKGQPDTGKDSHKIYEHALNDDFNIINSVQHRNDHDTNSKKSTRTAKRSEYVINYDDKNGTVSSICKIKPGHSQSKRKPVAKEKSKDDSKEVRHRTLNKTPLLQLPEQQWIRNGLTQGNRKWKTKNRVQRSCQLL